MRLKTPSFWYQKKGVCAWLLMLPSLIYGLGRKIDVKRSEKKRASIPIICIGNLTAGGTGKTPICIALLKLLADSAPCFISRGYGRKDKEVKLVDLSSDTHLSVGDEPLLLADHAPTIVGADRYESSKLASALGYKLIIMDDGLQNTKLDKDISFCVIDGASGFGNEMLMPAGPLRERIEDGLKRIDAFIITGEDQLNIKERLPKDKPIFIASLDVSPNFKYDKQSTYIGFCGIGRPGKFEDSLINAGLKLDAFYSYADHHVFTQAELDELLRKAEKINARLITTAKDVKRIPLNFIKDNDIDILPVELNWEDESALKSFLEEKLKKAKAVR